MHQPEVAFVCGNSARTYPWQEHYYAVDEEGKLTRITFEDVQNLLSSGIQLPVPQGIVPIRNPERN